MMIKSFLAILLLSSVVHAEDLRYVLTKKEEKTQSQCVTASNGVKRCITHIVGGSQAPYDGFLFDNAAMAHTKAKQRRCVRNAAIEKEFLIKKSDIQLNTEKAKLENLRIQRQLEKEKIKIALESAHHTNKELTIELKKSENTLFWGQLAVIGSFISGVAIGVGVVLASAWALGQTK